MQFFTAEPSGFIPRKINVNMQVSLKIAMPCPPSRMWTRAQSTVVIDSYGVSLGEVQPGCCTRFWGRLPYRPCRGGAS